MFFSEKEKKKVRKEEIMGKGREGVSG